MKLGEMTVKVRVSNLIIFYPTALAAVRLQQERNKRNDMIKNR